MFLKIFLILLFVAAVRPACPKAKARTQALAGVVNVVSLSAIRSRRRRSASASATLSTRSTMYKVFLALLKKLDVVRLKCLFFESKNLLNDYSKLT